MGKNLDSRAPEIAVKRSEAARRRLECGVRALERIKTPILARAAIEKGWPSNVEQFRKWKHVGNDTLYTTNKSLLPRLKHALKAFNRLAHTPQRSARGGQVQELLAKIQELEREIHCKDELISTLAKEILLAAKHWEAERQDKMYFMNRLGMSSASTTAPRAPLPNLPATNSDSLEERVSSIMQHRARREAAIAQDRKTQNDSDV